MLRKIILYPEAVLKSISKPYVHGKVKKVLIDLVETVTHYRGVGLSACQTGYPKRICAIRDDDRKDFLFLINPVILKYSDETNVDIEGCLSLPGIEAEVIRSNAIEIEYLDENMKQRHEIISDPFISRVIQHEVDHMNGQIFLDRIDEAEKQLKLIAFEEAKRILYNGLLTEITNRNC